ncbi:DNA repair helicase [Venturia nashicola]|nr:DNA repair helicase [Venturia nashicola]
MAQMNFYHPFQPYPIQEEFMNAVYECIEEGKIGIFESPTGTGKSLSLICGSLTWLREHKRKEFDESLIRSADDDDDDPEWMKEHARNERRRNALQHRQDLEKRLAKVRERERKLKQSYENGEPVNKRRKVANADGLDEPGDGQFLLDDYESDGEDGGGIGRGNNNPDGLSAETQALLKRLGMNYGLPTIEEDAEMPDELKIFFCSRTHSQLSQFSNELRRVHMPPAIESDPPDPGIEPEDLSEEIKHLTLGSRKNLCINPNVNKLGSATAINERCLELQQSGTSTDCKCPHLPNKENETLVHDFRDHALARIRDIEDLGVIGKKLGICPYYASRPAIRPSEIVTLPYPLLLQKSAREALNLSLKGHVIIIDEAHNLMDAISGIYSISVSLAQLERGRGQLMVYLQKFRNRLKGSNRVYVTQTVRMLDSLVTYLKDRSSKGREMEGQVAVGELMMGKGVDQINLFKLTRYLQDSKLARKVDGYVLHTEQEAQAAAKKATPRTQGPKAPKELSVPVLTHIQGFLLALMNPSAEGRFFYSKTKDDNEITLKYMLLDPTFHFKEIVEEARAVILAGGTMSPMDDYIKHLFSYTSPTRIMTLSCGHVIPPSNLLAWPIIQGNDGIDFDLTFEKRETKTMIDRIGDTLLRLIQNIPDGVVVFFPSYAYLDSCIATWKKCPPPGKTLGKKTLYERLEDCKPIFLEPRSEQGAASTCHKPHHEQKSGPAATEALLQSYSTTITTSPTGTNRGALLLSVINGSLSEGINFSDRLGRAVIVIGLPYPNPHSAEWKAKMEYISSKACTTAMESELGKGEAMARGKLEAREFYENTMMRAVNQAVGRAIRHKGDYAAVLLVDGRWAGERVRGKLPGWIKGSLRRGGSVGEVQEGLRGFFEGFL